MQRYDERDTIFARMSYKEGSKEYEDYYKRNPDKIDVDKELRSLPLLGEEGAAMYHRTNSNIMNSAFEFLSDLHPLCEGEPAPVKQTDLSPEVMTKKLKGLASYYNAKLVGVSKLFPHHYYSHRGRHAKNYGESIDKHHAYGIVYAVEMDQDMIYRAPQLSETIAVTKGYVDSAIIGMIIAYFVRSLGYEARNHMDGNYLVIAPLVARDAGLGELGRNGLLITKELGARVRLGVVTTDLPLVPDEPIDFGLEQFCTECEQCVRTCPGKSIPSGPKQDIDGIKRWKIEPESCYKRWRSLGTDCGICLANCPFSDPINSDLVNQLKDSKEARETVLNNFREKFKIRPYIRGNASWLEE